MTPSAYLRALDRAAELGPSIRCELCEGTGQIGPMPDPVACLACNETGVLTFERQVEMWATTREHPTIEEWWKEINPIIRRLESLLKIRTLLPALADVVEAATAYNAWEHENDYAPEESEGRSLHNSVRFALARLFDAIEGVKK